VTCTHNNNIKNILKFRGWHGHGIWMVLDSFLIIAVLIPFYTQVMGKGGIPDNASNP
jgi:hypothetical protein